MKLEFGKYKNMELEEIPTEYLFWLCCWEIVDNVQSIWQDFEGENWRAQIDAYLQCNSGAECYLLRNHMNVVWKARDEFHSRRCCALCFRHMPAIGTSRLNGKHHNDWDNRTLHKKCWRACS
jgi:hypothetical protein